MFRPPPKTPSKPFLVGTPMVSSRAARQSLPCRPVAHCYRLLTRRPFARMWSAYEEDERE
jgi:hypothetical protein